MNKNQNDLAEVYMAYGKMETRIARAFAYFLPRIGRVVTQDALRESWEQNDRCMKSDESIRSLIRGVRRKLRELEKPPFQLETIYGIGWMVREGSE